MLTEQQLKNLAPLCENPKFGKLLSDAIEIWKREDVLPLNNSFGLKIDYKSQIFELSEYDRKYKYKCCLVGAAVVGKEKKESVSCFIDIIYKAIKENYDIDSEEIRNIVDLIMVIHY